MRIAEGVRIVSRSLFCLMLVMSWSGSLARLAPADSPPPASRPSPEVVAAEVDRVFAGLAKAASDLPRDTFDPSAIVAAAGEDPARLAAWVREHTWWVPYHGVLRGAMGVQMDRLGNSVDRSLLLAELLRRSGHTVRLARADLDPATADKLLSAVRPVPDVRLPGSPVDRTPQQIADDFVRQFVTPFGIDEGRARRHLGDALLKGNKLTEEMVSRTAEQAPLLANLVRLPAPAAAPAGPSAAARAAAADHWWVQVQREGRWADLDVMSPAADLASPAPPASTVEFKNDASILDALPCHEVQVRIIVEQLAGGRLTEHPVLTHVFRPAEMIGRSVRLTHLPADWNDKLDLLAHDGAARFQQLAAAQTKWVPMLIPGGDTAIYQGSFSDTGEIVAKANLNAMKTLGGRIGAIGSALDDPPPAAAADGRLTAEWIEYEIRVPGRPAATVRRQVFDLLGPAARASGNLAGFQVTPAGRLERGMTLLGDLEMLMVPCQLSSQYNTHLALRAALANRPALKGLIVGMYRPQPDNPSEYLSNLSSAPGDLHAFAIARGAANRLGAELYYDTVNIFSMHQFALVEPVDAALQVMACRAFDIVENHLAVRASSRTPAAQVRLEQGVWDTNTEALLMSGCGRVQNTATSFASAGDGDWLTLRTPEDLPRISAGYSPDARQRIADDLKAGRWVVAAGAAGKATGWWRINPATGQTLGIGSTGWGDAVAYIGLIRAVLSYAAMAFCIVGVATAKIAAGAQFALIIACTVAGAAGGTSNAIGGLFAESAVTAGAVGLLADIAALAAGGGGLALSD